MPHQNKIIIKGLTQNNLKNISLEIPKEKIVVFTGVSGSGKSSIVFDAIAAECGRQMNETYPAFIRGRLPKYEKPKSDLIQNLSASVIIDQSCLGGNARSTVGTITDLYAMMRVLFSRIGSPYVGTASCFSFNDPTGMCPECSGLGKVTKLNMDAILQEGESLRNQAPITATGRSTPATYLGFFDEIRKLLATENGVNASLFSFNSKGACPVCNGKGMVVTELVFMDPVVTVCEACDGKRYSDEALSYRYHGKNIVEILELSAEDAFEFFKENSKISKVLKAMIEVGLPYLSLGQSLSTLSGGERQRVKLAKNLYKKGNIYVLDEPTTGLHASDVKNIMKLLDSLVKRGNTVIVIEHNLDVMKQADYLIDIGPDGGTTGGEVVFRGTPQEMKDIADTITSMYLRKSLM